MWWVACALDPNCMPDKTWTPTDRWHTGNPSICKGRKYHLTCPRIGKQNEQVAKPDTPKLECSRPDQSSLNVLCANVDQIHPISWLSATKRRPTRWYTKPIPICGNETPLL
ncbi:MAG: hypothetical protein KVP17_003906 [Porospora cf. gigantea B]|uniref:uncharacterized protein n=1 Tax=Porospora cf. gigantea B TaxID=2853592 RepID=UPI003571828A|nr:MAG: hypothetical protein KVP17_003906 [Porospora cf. gigantea B]